MGMFEFNDEGIVIKRPLTWREPLWSRIHDIVSYRYRWVALLILIAVVFIVLTFVGINDIVDRDDSALTMTSLGLFTVSISAAATVFIRTAVFSKRIVPDSQLDLSEYMRYHSKLPRRWRRQWVKAFGGSGKALNSYLYGVLANLQVENYYEMDEPEFLFQVRYTYRSEAAERLDVLRSLGISYKSYPAAAMLLLSNVDPEYILKWDKEHVDMVGALGRIMRGTNPQYIGAMVANDIDSSLMDALIHGDDATLAMSSR